MNYTIVWALASGLGGDTFELHVTTYFIDGWNGEKLDPTGIEFFQVSSINSLFRNIILYTKEYLACIMRDFARAANPFYLRI